ncbi:MAG: hypothetical protein GY789_24420 [Hyphomicrobiales bacterium]|nr:hypothetical protein [Hyphomicrobiales bacterium]MCP5001446.1 hypothetical protein [Hyphomicrobiales bacterium]
MSKRWFFAWALLPAIFINADVAVAEVDVCDGVRLLMDTSDRQLSYVDVGEKGPSTGDMRIGKASLLDSSGEKVGETFFRVMLLHPEEGGDSFSSAGTQYFHFPQGKIHLEVLINQYGPDVDDVDTIHPRSVPEPPPLQLVALGGSGQFEGVGGIVSMEKLENGLAYNFDLNCP